MPSMSVKGGKADVWEWANKVSEVLEAVLCQQFLRARSAHDRMQSPDHAHARATAPPRGGWRDMAFLGEVWALASRARPSLVPRP